MKILVTSNLFRGYGQRNHAHWIKSLPNFDVMVVLGNLASHKKEHYKSACEVLRKNIDTPILVIESNHDYWDSDFVKYEEFREKWRAKHDITHVGGKEFVFDRCTFYGIDNYWLSQLDKFRIQQKFGKDGVVWKPDQYLKHRAKLQIGALPVADRKILLSNGVDTAISDQFDLHFVNDSTKYEKTRAISPGSTHDNLDYCLVEY